MAKKFPDPKDPGDDLDFTVNCADLIPAGDAIATVVWTIPAGLTGHTTSHTDTTATTWLSGGAVPEGGAGSLSYTIHLVITTVAGRVFDRDVILKTKQL